MVKVCAYCDEEKPLTNDHVWPSGFLDRMGRRSAHHSPKSGKVHGADYVVGDVCARCNNELLSKLDAYFCRLYDEQIGLPKGPNESVLFHYDYDLLLRSLLKIAYNTARSAGSETAPFKRLRPYILSGGDPPDGIALIAELVSPSYIAGASGDGLSVTEIRPTMYRSARCELRTPHGDAVLLRFVAVSSFFFHLLLARDVSNFEPFRKAQEEFLAGIDGAVLLESGKDSALLRSSPQDSLSSMLPLLMAKRSEYREFFEKRKSRDKKG